MPDDLFEHPRLAAIYDAFDPRRLDLLPYVAMAKEFRAQTVVDIGCGTGSLACLLAKDGFEVTGLEPASASLNCARAKPFAERVKWIEGDSSKLGQLNFDLALMTGNVAQVFLSDSSWSNTLTDIRRTLRHQGLFIFESRDPAKKAWLDWSKEKTLAAIHVHGVGKVVAWCDLVETEGQFVSFRWTFQFEADGMTLVSDSTLRFRTRSEIEASLEAEGFVIHEVRDAPDRPGKEHVFIARVR